MQTRQFYTDTHTSVNKRIENEKTFPFKDKSKAEAKARELRSYVYDLYENVKGRLVFWGYAVPKLILIALMFTACTSDDDCIEPRDLELIYLKCDTQDQIYNAGEGWTRNGGFDTLVDSDFKFWRESPVFRIESKFKIESLIVDGLWYAHEITYIDDYNVEIYCEFWENYFDHTDLVNVTLLLEL